jgi:hypothetical protein
MTRLSKRSIASRKGSKASALKRQKIASSRGLEAPPTSGLSEICSGSAEIQAGSLNTDARESCEWESDAQSDGFLSEEEDKYPIRQPEAGWKEAEGILAGYSSSRTYKQKTTYHRNKKEIKRKKEEKKALSAGIPVTQGPKPVWGDISQMFKSSVVASPGSPASTLLSQSSSTQETQSFSGQENLSATNWEASTLIASPGHGCSELSVVRSYVPPNFEEVFLNCQNFKKEARELELWLKSKKEQLPVTGLCVLSAYETCYKCNTGAPVKTKV